MKKLLFSNTSKITVFTWLLISYEIALSLNNDAYLPALPSVMQDLETTHHLVQLTLSTWFLGYAIPQLLIGPLSDRFGRKKLLLTGSIISLLATLGCALSQTIYYLLLFRLVQGMMVGTMIIPGYTTIHELYESNEAIKKIAFMRGIFILAPAFGPMFGSLILGLAGWRWIFGITTICIILSNVGLYFTMPETCPVKKRKSLHIMHALSQYKNILFNKKFLQIALTSCCFYAAMTAWITAGPFLVISTFQYSPLNFALFQCLIFSTFIIGTKIPKLLLGILSAEKLAKNTILFTLIFSLLSLILSIYFHTISLLIIYIMIISLATGTCSPILNRKAVELSNESMGLSVTLYTFFFAISGSWSSIMITAFYNEKIHSLIMLLVLLMLIAFTSSWKPLKSSA